MPITFTIPESIEQELTQQLGDLGQAAKEALVIEGYRTGKLSIGQVARTLGFETRFQAEEWLGRHGVPWNYSPEELQADRQVLRTLLDEGR
jgi:predicted HTH domain antitoxin